MARGARKIDFNLRLIVCNYVVVYRFVRQRNTMKDALDTYVLLFALRSQLFLCCFRRRISQIRVCVCPFVAFNWRHLLD